MMNFCTLFDSYYIDKGITLARSLQEACPGEFNLYIFCFDERSREVLTDLKLPGVTVLSHLDLERDYEILNKLKQERSKAEYCWTCTPVTIEYVLNHYDVDNCTYIDADIYFFDNPKVLFDELMGDNVIITPHRFSNSLKDKRFLNRSGKYCVEFNYFDKSENAKKVLTWWRDKCFEWCFHLYEKDRMGDQKYLERFPELFEGVHELQNLGGGMAPWNLAQYEFVEYVDEEENNSDFFDRIKVREKSTGKVFQPVFYHFQDIRYLPNRKVNIKSNSHDKILKYALYKPYLMDIEDTRKMLKDRYDIDFSLKKAYASNKLIAFVQKNVLQYKIKSLSDIIKLDELSRRG